MYKIEVFNRYKLNWNVWMTFEAKFKSSYKLNWNIKMTIEAKFKKSYKYLANQLSKEYSSIH